MEGGFAMTRFRLPRRRLFHWAALAVSQPVLPSSALAAPAPRWLPLIETHVAGTAYYDAERVADALRRGMPLELRREPANAYDTRAIEVFTEAGIKLGYVPRVRNPPFAALMDDGQALRATVVRVRGGVCPDIRFTLDLCLPA